MSVGLRHEGRGGDRGIRRLSWTTSALQVCAVSLSHSPEWGRTDDSLFPFLR